MDDKSSIQQKSTSFSFLYSLQTTFYMASNSPLYILLPGQKMLLGKIDNFYYFEFRPYEKNLLKYFVNQVI